MNILKHIKALSVPRLGMDFSLATFKLLALQKTPHGYKVEAFAFLEEENNSQLTIEVKALKQQLFPTAKIVALAVPGQSALTRVLQTKSIYSDAQIIEQIEVEAERLLPFPLEEIYYDFARIPHGIAAREEVEVFLAAASRERVNDLLGSAKEFGLNVKAVELEQLAIERAFLWVVAALPITAQKTIALFDLQAQTISLYVFKDLRLHYYQTHSFIAETRLQEVEHALQAFLSAADTLAIESILLAGSETDLPALSKQVATHFGKETFVANPFTKIEVSPKINQEALLAKGPQLLVALGLALKSFEDTGINLLPWREEKRKAENRFFYMVLTGVIGVTFLLLSAMQFLLGLKIAQEKRNLTYLTKEESLLNEKVQTLQGLQKAKKVLLNRRKIIETLQENRGSMVTLLDKIVYLVPEGIFLTEMVKKKKKIILEGQARTNSEISLLLKNLEEDPIFAAPKLNEVAIAKKEEWLTFKIECSLSVLDEHEETN
jgi:type IV pilus assembly protein PilM